MYRQPEQETDLLTPAAVAAVFFVDPKTVTRWAAAGKIDAIRTPGGHRRFHRSDVIALFDTVHEDRGRLAVPSLSEASPGSPAAAAAAVIAEAAAVALEAEADAATEAVAQATAVLQNAHAKASQRETDARQARVLAAVHAAYAEPSIRGSEWLARVAPVSRQCAGPPSSR
jgi:excisionase family DNA binding protein